MKIRLISLSFLIAATALADMQMQMDPNEAKFMQDMDVKMKQMDKDMAAPMSGNVDRDFVIMMLPHHKGAVDMAQGELSYGKDPDMRKLAQEIVDNQNTEIALMKKWLEKHPAMQGM
jgi:uncharacterized protein (DUF305 family)